MKVDDVATMSVKLPTDFLELYTFWFKSLLNHY